MKYNSLSLILAASAILSSAASAVTFDVFAQGNSSSGGSPLSTIALSAGQPFSVSASPTDLWAAGGGPRWSDADGLNSERFATGTDESGETAGTHIGTAFPSWTQNGFTAPYGALVGRIGTDYLLLGTSYSGLAPAAGNLELFYWDENNGDNAGKITVSVNAQNVPETGGYTVLFIAAAGLAVMKRFSIRPV